MPEVKKYASIKTKDVADIMRLLCVKHALSPLAYKRLHYYVVSLEHMLEEALNTVRDEQTDSDDCHYHIQAN